MNDWSKDWPAPAKLNLMLRVVGRREDGYHELQTVFQFVEYCDLLDFRLRRDGAVRRVTAISGLAEHDDLVVRAARLLQQYAQVSAGADIRISKRLPMGGGLGGGSSDAATVLAALNRLWRCELTNQELAKLGLSLGADVPIFVHGHAAWAEGLGECLEPIELPEPWFLVVLPPCHVSTRGIFQDPQLTRDSPRITIRAFAQGDTRNDCVPVVRRRYPEVAQALDWLGAHAEARLTGTGACVFAELGSQREARELIGHLPAGFTGFVARGMNRSPLLSRLAVQAPIG